MSRGIVALIESNTSGTGALFVREVRRLGYQPLLLTKDPQRYSFLRRASVPVHVVDTDTDDVTDACHRLLRRQQLKAVLTSSDHFTLTTARVAATLKLPGYDPDAVAVCRNKFRQRERLHGAGIPQPRFAHVRSVEEALAAAREFDQEVVLKPVSGSGSWGVRLCRSADEIRTHATQWLNVRHNERGQRIPRALLMEELVEGVEYSAEVFGCEIVGITRKHISRPPYFVETGHDFPASDPLLELGPVSDFVRAAVAAVGLLWGPAHLEFRVTPTGPKVIEINPRLAGGNIPVLVRLAHGIDLVRNTIRLHLNKRVSLLRRQARFASIRFLCITRSGTIAGVNGLQQARRTAGVEQVRIIVRSGQQVHCYNDFRDRVGYLIVAGESSARVRSNADRAVGGLNLVYV